MLLRTRCSVVEQTGAEALCARVEEITPQRPSQPVDLLIICHTVSKDERQSIAARLRKRWPGVRVVQLVKHEYESTSADPHADFVAVATNPVGLAIARTLQQNGAYIGDNSGSGAGVKTEQNANYPGLDADSLRGCMTWDDVEFLPLGYAG